MVSDLKTVEITAESWKALKLEAIRQERPQYEIASEAIQAYVDAANDQRRANGGDRTDD